MHKVMKVGLAIVASFGLMSAIAAAPNKVMSPEGLSESAKAAVQSHIAKANGIAVRIKATTGGIDQDNFRSLQQALLGASPEALEAAASATSYKAAMRAIRAAERGTGNALKGKALGDVAKEFVFYPIVPCRLLDTREGTGQKLASLTPYPVDFDGGNPGNVAGCTFSGVSAQIGGIGGLTRSALAINLTVVAPDGAGYIQVRPVGTTNVTSNQNYGVNEIVATMAIVQDAGTTNEFELYSLVPTHAVVDVMGMFAPPLATALDCQDTANTTVSGIAPGGTANAVAPACPSGYIQTATNCEASSWLVPFVFFHSGTCSARNNDASAQDIRASRTCCRVPGR